MSVIAQDPILRRFPSDVCRCCHKPIKTANHIDSKPRWLVNSSMNTKRGFIVNLVQGCDVCSDMEVCIKEAEAEKRRFTQISVFNFPCDHGTRCMCGAVSVGLLGYCVRCSIANRMLDKAMAESRVVANMLKDLRRQVKESLKEQPNGR